MSGKKQVYGVQSVLEALKQGARVDAVYIARAAGGQTERIRAMAKQSGVKVVMLAKDELTKRTGSDRHQGVLALLDTNEVDTVSVAEILSRAASSGRPPLVLLLDGIQDPQNLGACLRTAHALGAHGLVIPKDRAAQVTDTVMRVSAGAALHVPIARVTNLKHALDALVEGGCFTAAAVMDGDPAPSVRLDGAMALVIGGEAKGVRQTLASRCDIRVRIPMIAGFDSLNASVAAGILLYEIQRQRSAANDALVLDSVPQPD